MFSMWNLRGITCAAALLAGSKATLAQPPPPPAAAAAPQRPARPAPPTRDPHTTGYVTAKELPDSMNPSATADGNFILGPTHSPAPEMAVKEGVPQGTVNT